MLPAYNEEESLPSLLVRINRFRNFSQIPVKILVVNDGSKDKTLEIAQEAADDVLNIQPNKGLANGVREGIKYATRNMDDHDILVIMDADDSQPPDLIGRMIQQINEGSDIVIASRYRKGARILGLTWFRRLMSFCAGLLFKIMVPIKGVRDYTCGFRAYKVSFLRQLMQVYGDNLVQQKGFGVMAEILIKSKPLKPIIHELPFILRYDQKQGLSKMNVSRTVKQTLKMLFLRR